MYGHDHLPFPHAAVNVTQLEWDVGARPRGQWCTAIANTHTLTNTAEGNAKWEEEGRADSSGRKGGCLVTHTSHHITSTKHLQAIVAHFPHHQPQARHDRQGGGGIELPVPTAIATTSLAQGGPPITTSVTNAITHKLHSV